MLTSRPAFASLASVALAAGLAAQDYHTVTFLQTNQVIGGGFHRRDLDGNGQYDVIIELYSGPTAGIYTLLNPGMTATSATVTTALPLSAVSSGGGGISLIGIADMNADSIPDLVAEFDGVFAASRVLYAPGNGLGGFGGPVTVAVSQISATISTIGDFDGNGQTDFAYLHSVSPGTQVNVFLQTSGTFQSALSLAMVGVNLIAGDFNGDGFDDLAMLGSGTLTVQPGGTTFGPPVTFAVAPQLNNGFAADLDADGNDDLILQVASSSPWRLFALFGHPTSYLAPPIDVLPGGLPFVSDYIGHFDVDADGRDELLAALRNTNGYRLLRHNGNRGFSAAPYATTMNGGLIDLDLDGDLDQLVPNLPGGGYTRRANLAIFGTACSGVAGEPRFDLGSAIPGNAAFTIAIANAAPNAPAQLFFGLSPTPGPCGPQLDLGLIVLPIPGTPLFADFTDAGGRITYAAPIPFGLPAGPYFMQGVVFDQAGAFSVFGQGLATTPGRALRAY